MYVYKYVYVRMYVIINVINLYFLRCGQTLMPNADYCRTVHAFRSGFIEVDPSMQTMFDTLIAPAYYASNLEHPLSLIKAIFESSGRQWVTDDEKLKYVGSAEAPDWVSIGQNRAKMFINSSPFSEYSFRRMIGCMFVNALSVDLLPSQVSGNQSSVTGTGLCEIYAKMNHSCECNTINESCARAFVRVSALRDIPAGHEITTSYLNVTNAGLLSRKKRAKKLRQYLFVCHCDLCDRQKLEEDNSDSEDEEEEEEGIEEV